MERPVERPVERLVGEFHQQMEKILFEAAGAAVREKATSTLDDVRHGLREEAKAVLTELASSQTGPWIEQSLKQLNKVSQESAKTLHAAWTRRLDSDIRRALERVEERSKELDHLAQSLSANALDRLQRGLESSREEGVDRIVSRLKEQSAPVIDHAKETIAGLVQQREELERVLDQALSKATGKIEEVCTGFETKFEMIVRERLDSAREELQKTIQAAMSASLDRFHSSAQRQEAEAQSALTHGAGPYRGRSWRHPAESRGDNPPVLSRAGEPKPRAPRTRRHRDFRCSQRYRKASEAISLSISLAPGRGSWDGRWQLKLHGPTRPARSRPANVRAMAAATA
jgi:exonuclease VII large subunit